MLPQDHSSFLLHEIAHNGLQVWNFDAGHAIPSGCEDPAKFILTSSSTKEWPSYFAVCCTPIQLADSRWMKPRRMTSCMACDVLHGDASIQDPSSTRFETRHMKAHCGQTACSSALNCDLSIHSFGM